MIRKATEEDINAVVTIYSDIHTEEEAGHITVGWKREIYPTYDTAMTALKADDLFVYEDESGHIVAAGRINRIQVPEYAQADWHYRAADDQVMVLHTLVVSPSCSQKGTGKAFVAFYEAYALKEGCPYLRIDTNERNLVARRMYAKLGYREASIVPCSFNGLEGVQLVCLEKYLGDRN